MKVIVVGAGIVGTCSASYLLRDGHDVVLVDSEGPGVIRGGGPVSRRFNPVEKDIGEIRWHAERGPVEANGHLRA